MIRRSPAEFYIKYLVAHPANYQNQDIKDRIEAQQLDYLGNWYVDKLRASCVPPSPFYPKDPSHFASYRFLLKERIHTLFVPDDDTSTALKILEKPRLKEYVEAMILSGAPDAAVAKALSTQKGFPCTGRALLRYRHYFWNTELVDSTEMRALLQLRVEATGQHAEPEVRGQVSALVKASYRDPRRVAAELPASPITAILAQMRMGSIPSTMDLAKILILTRAAAALRASEAALYGGPDDSQRALNYQSVSKLANEMLETVVKPDEALRNELSVIALRTDESAVPSLADLRGQHTVDLEVELDSNGQPAQRSNGAPN